MKIADEYDYDKVARHLLEDIYDSVAFSPDWEDLDFSGHPEIERWERRWASKIAYMVENGVRKGKIKDDSWLKFKENIKNSDVGRILKLAKTELEDTFFGITRYFMPN